MGKIIHIDKAKTQCQQHQQGNNYAKTAEKSVHIFLYSIANLNLFKDKKIFLHGVNRNWQKRLQFNYFYRKILTIFAYIYVG